jgi:hypothetical protein
MERTMSADFNFLKEEYLSLRKEVENVILELRQLERNCVIAVAVAFTWVATQKLGHEIAQVAWLIPPIIPLYGAIRSNAIGKHLVVMSNYIKTIEKASIPDGDGIMGWEHYLEANSPGALNAASKQLWMALLLMSALVSAIGFWKA